VSGGNFDESGLNDMDFFLRGGPLMWPILLESVIALWVVIERCVFIFSSLPARKKALVALTELISRGDYKFDPEIHNHLGDFAKAIGKAKEDGSLNLGLLGLEADRLIGETEKHLTILNAIVQTAPLLGLLGTVTGMIKAFMQVQAMGGQVNASDLAGGIWEALITTAGGLFVAIPALIAYIAFARAADRYARNMESAVSQIVHSFTKDGIEVV
jgi:biopolymer transport protein ExbB